ncbi:MULTISPECIES: MFS transporter [unclassified Microbacterium]|uniref:MFS transporter n=1 Tax=unclassified Microbacterium TaxID=2609290 RepID=UPI000CFABC31|nr:MULTISPECIES: MFS transporter [unclassified Microbacterium]PQZ50865.1 MFS transporter [Microbacterium sp. MYb43]PQZ73218.1 MFS transporter [Microbacterium sp. MYb40]PRB15086.1 MFS transporter [Microbacterium sp. MYb54]PRB21987.1 MFS transporter [Microbacterium sp. MYb50]PRB59707.1 MFS transporter [Microbacterium sp. MYb24]
MSGNGIAPDTRTPEEVGASAMKKAIWRLGPFLGLLYLVAYMDRNNAGFAKLEMTAALQITEAVFGFAAGIFFIGYLLFEVPSNLLLEKFGARKWIARIMISWGIVASLTAFVQDGTQFAIARFVLGIAEAGFFPGVLLYLTLWFPRQYRTQVLAVFVLSNPIANAVAAPLSGWMLELHGMWGLDGWQLVFLLQGIPAVLLAFVVFFWLPDRPQDARWLDSTEQRWINDTLAAETAATEQKHGRLRLREVFSNGRLWTLIVLFFGVVFGAYGLGMWLPTIVKSMGDFSNSTTGWLVALPNLCAALVMLPWERAARKQGNIPLQIGITLSITALSLIAAVAAQGTPILALVALCVGMSALFSTTPLFWSLPPMVLTGTAAAAGLAFINSVGNLAGFAGPYAIGWISETTGSAIWGLLLIAALTLLGATIAFVLSRRADFTVPAEVLVKVDTKSEVR